MKDFIKDYLTFTKKERRGIAVLFILILSGVVIPLFFKLTIPQPTDNIETFRSDIKSLKPEYNSGNDSAADKSGYRSKSYYKHNYENDLSRNKINLFNFDPNLASVKDWGSLGIREKTALTIQKYLAKGGHFYQPKDLEKIYGMREEDLKRLIPFIRISPPMVKNNAGKKFQVQNSYHHKSLSTAIDINLADTATLMTLPGIGPSLSKRIIHFRERLGGFYSVEQVKETFGLPDSTFEKIKPKLLINDTTIKKIDLNQVTIEELKSHPYIKYQTANAIIQYRKQHGKFESISDLKNILIIPEELFLKIAHYIMVK